MFKLRDQNQVVEKLRSGLNTPRTPNTYNNNNNNHTNQISNTVHPTSTTSNSEALTIPMNINDVSGEIHDATRDADPRFFNPSTSSFSSVAHNNNHRQPPQTAPASPNNNNNNNNPTNNNIGINTGRRQMVSSSALRRGDPLMSHFVSLPTSNHEALVKLFTETDVPEEAERLQKIVVPGELFAAAEHRAEISEEKFSTTFIKLQQSEHEQNSLKIQIAELHSELSRALTHVSHFKEENAHLVEIERKDKERIKELARRLDEAKFQVDEIEKKLHDAEHYVATLQQKNVGIMAKSARLRADVETLSGTTNIMMGAAGNNSFLGVTNSYSNNNNNNNNGSAASINFMANNNNSNYSSNDNNTLLTPNILHMMNRSGMLGNPNNNNNNNQQLTAPSSPFINNNNNVAGVITMMMHSLMTLTEVAANNNNNNDNNNFENEQTGDRLPVEETDDVFTLVVPPALDTNSNTTDKITSPTTISSTNGKSNFLPTTTASTTTPSTNHLLPLPTHFDPQLFLQAATEFEHKYKQKARELARLRLKIFTRDVAASRHILGLKKIVDDTQNELASYKRRFVRTLAMNSSHSVSMMGRNSTLQQNKNNNNESGIVSVGRRASSRQKEISSYSSPASSLQQQYQQQQHPIVAAATAQLLETLSEEQRKVLQTVDLNSIVSQLANNQIYYNNTVNAATAAAAIGMNNSAMVFGGTLDDEGEDGNDNTSEAFAKRNQLIRNAISSVRGSRSTNDHNINNNNNVETDEQRFQKEYAKAPALPNGWSGTTNMLNENTMTDVASGRSVMNSKKSCASHKNCQMQRHVLQDRLAILEKAMMQTFDVDASQPRKHHHIAVANQNSNNTKKPLGVKRTSPSTNTNKTIPQKPATTTTTTVVAPLPSQPAVAPSTTTATPSSASATVPEENNNNNNTVKTGSKLSEMLKDLKRSQSQTPPENSATKTSHNNNSQSFLDSTDPPSSTKGEDENDADHHHHQEQEQQHEIEDDDPDDADNNEHRHHDPTNSTATLRGVLEKFGPDYKKSSLGQMLTHLEDANKFVLLLGTESMPEAHNAGRMLHTNRMLYAASTAIVDGAASFLSGAETAVTALTTMESAIFNAQTLQEARLLWTKAREEAQWVDALGAYVDSGSVALRDSLVELRCYAKKQKKMEQALAAGSSSGSQLVKKPSFLMTDEEKRQEEKRRKRKEKKRKEKRKLQRRRSQVRSLGGGDIEQEGDDDDADWLDDDYATTLGDDSSFGSSDDNDDDGDSTTTGGRRKRKNKRRNSKRKLREDGEDNDDEEDEEGEDSVDNFTANASSESSSDEEEAALDFKTFKLAHNIYNVIREFELEFLRQKSGGIPARQEFRAYTGTQHASDALFSAYNREQALAKNTNVYDNTPAGIYRLMHDTAGKLRLVVPLLVNFSKAFPRWDQISVDGSDEMLKLLKTHQQQQKSASTNTPASSASINKKIQEAKKESERAEVFRTEILSRSHPRWRMLLDRLMTFTRKIDAKKINKHKNGAGSWRLDKQRERREKQDREKLERQAIALLEETHGAAVKMDQYGNLVPVDGSSPNVAAHLLPSGNRTATAAAAAANNNNVSPHFRPKGGVPPVVARLYPQYAAKFTKDSSPLNNNNRDNFMFGGNNNQQSSYSDVGGQYSSGGEGNYNFGNEGTTRFKKIEHGPQAAMDRWMARRRQILGGYQYQAANTTANNNAQNTIPKGSESEMEGLLKISRTTSFQTNNNLEIQNGVILSSSSPPRRADSFQNIRNTNIVNGNQTPTPATSNLVHNQNSFTNQLPDQAASPSSKRRASNVSSTANNNSNNNSTTNHVNSFTSSSPPQNLNQQQNQHQQQTIVFTIEDIEKANPEAIRALITKAGGVGEVSKVLRASLRDEQTKTEKLQREVLQLKKQMDDMLRDQNRDTSTVAKVRYQLHDEQEVNDRLKRELTTTREEMAHLRYQLEKATKLINKGFIGGVGGGGGPKNGNDENNTGFVEGTNANNTNGVHAGAFSGQTITAASQLQLFETNTGRSVPQQQSQQQNVTNNAKKNSIFEAFSVSKVGAVATTTTNNTNNNPFVLQKPQPQQQQQQQLVQSRVPVPPSTAPFQQNKNNLSDQQEVHQPQPPPHLRNLQNPHQRQKQSASMNNNSSNNFDYSSGQNVFQAKYQQWASGRR